MPLVISEITEVPPIVWASDRNGNASALGASPALSRPFSRGSPSPASDGPVPARALSRSRVAAERGGLQSVGSFETAGHRDSFLETVRFFGGHAGFSSRKQASFIHLFISVSVIVASFNIALLFDSSVCQMRPLSPDYLSAAQGEWSYHVVLIW